MFNLALGVFLLLSPIFNLFISNARLNGQMAALGFYQYKALDISNNAVQLQFFQYGVFILLAVALSQKPIREFKDRNFAGIFFMCVVSVLFHPKTVMSFTPVLCGFLLYYLIVVYTKNIKSLLLPIVIISALNTFFAILQFFNIRFPYGSAGLMCSASHLGTYQAIALPICFYLHPFLSIIPLVGILISKSYAALFASCFGLAYLLYPQRRKIIINLSLMGLIALFGIGIILFSRYGYSIIYKLQLRLEVWGEAIRQIILNPLAGKGLGVFSYIDKMGHWEWVYNEYLSIALYVGIPVLLFVYEFMKDKFKLRRRGLSRVITASCFIAAITCFVQPSLHFARLVGTIIVVFAFMEILKREENHNENSLRGWAQFL